MADDIKVRIDPDRYHEDNEDFVPDPTYQFGTVDTTGTAGRADNDIRSVTPVFDLADQQSALQAAAAIDPDDDTVAASNVVLPRSEKESDAELARERLRTRAEKARKEDFKIGSPTRAEREAAEERDSGREGAQKQQSSAGAGSAPSGSETTDTSRQKGGQKK